MSERMILNFNLASVDRYDETAPESAIEFIKWLSALIDTVPVEYRAHVKIALDDDGHDYPRPQLNIWWERPETDAELEARLVEESQWAANNKLKIEAKERAFLAALKQKYER